jgi:antitoxin component of RelBE/YafQ-DinJ toxin-antitoxin module
MTRDLHVRLDQKTSEQLENVIEYLGIDKSVIVRIAIKYLIHLYNKGELMSWMISQT